MRFFFRVEYDGSRYGGWQRQPNAVSIQERLEQAFAIVLRKPVGITGAGRTDAGVHARGQGAHFDFSEELNISQCELSVNAVLPDDIAVYNLCPVNDSFHARFSATNRCYKYYLCFRKRPLHVKRVWTLYYTIDWDNVERNLGDLLGKHDFASFCASGSTTETTVCTVKKATLKSENGFYVFTIEADRFIYKMVRSVVGTLIDIGRGRLKATMGDIIDKRDRCCAGTTAPPSGLVLEYVAYEGVE